MLEGWTERLLGIEEAVAGEGTAWRIVPTYPWAPWLAVVFFLFTLGFVAYIYAREGAAGRGWKFLLASLRVAIIFLVAFAVLPGWKLSIDRTGLPFVVVIVDDSLSMRTADRLEDSDLRTLIAERVQAAGIKSAEPDFPSRLDQAKAILLGGDAQLLKTIEKNYRLKVYYLSETARAETGDAAETAKNLRALEPRGMQTRLGEGVRKVLADLSGTQSAAIILLTDGINTDGEQLSDVAVHAGRKQVPILAVGLGSDQVVRDLELHDLLVDEVVFVDDIVYFTATVTGTGFEGREVDLRLKEKGKDKVLAEMKVAIGPDGKPQQVRLPYRPPEVGEFDYVVEIAEQDRESNLKNNREQKHVSVRKERIRVLLVQSYPSFEFRYLKTMLERDRTIQLKTVLQEADLEYTEFDRSALPVFPVSQEKLDEQFDVILFGDVNPALLGAAAVENLTSFVTQKGGGIIFFGGPRYTPMAYANTSLAPLFPVDLKTAKAPPANQNIPKSFRPVLTDLGRASPHMQLGDTAIQTDEIWTKRLPGLYWLLEAPDVKPGARVLAEHPTRTAGAGGKKLPVIVMQPVGAGAVLFHASDDTWRWRYQVGDVYFARYWVQAIRFLSRSKLYGKSKQAELVSDRDRYRAGQTVRLRVRFLNPRAAPADDDGVTVMVERDETRTPLELKRTPTSRTDFEGLLTDPREGSYHVWLLKPTLREGPPDAEKGTNPEQWSPATDFVVLPPEGESERLPMNKTELERAASQTKGRFFTFATVDTLADRIPPGRPVPVESLPPYPIWNKWPLLGLFVLLIVTEWILRKLKGML